MRRAWYRLMHRLHLWHPATPYVRLWDKDMTYLTTLSHGQPAHYALPWRR